MKKIIRLPSGVTEFVIGRLPFSPSQTVKISVESSEGQLKHTVGYTDTLGQISISLNTLPLAGWFVRTMDYYIFKVYDLDNNPLTVLEIADNAIMADELYVYFSDAPSAPQYLAIFRDWVGCKRTISTGDSPVYIPTPRIEISGGPILNGNSPIYQHNYKIRVFWDDCQDKRFLNYNPEIWEFRYKTKRRSIKRNRITPSVKERFVIPSRWAHTYHMCNVGGMRPRQTEFPLKKINGAYVLPEKDVYFNAANNYTEKKFHRNTAVNIVPNFISLFNYDTNDNFLLTPIPRGQRSRKNRPKGRFNEYMKYAIVIKMDGNYYRSEHSSEKVQIGHNRVFLQGVLLRGDLPICRLSDGK